ncbi:response regulator transcription factor [Sneathiella glossodoripedis]|uniref:response regulator transcription factor n=1 Tax=Sneathiella glossodoripedis TaxID=418853 RepID=UPI00046F3249|nr:response regulator [Sneathiella glossodoripedis]
MSLQGAKIVAIDDTPSIRTFLKVTLESEGAEFYDAATAEEGLHLCEKVLPDIVVLDLGLPDADGLDILPQIKKTQEGDKPPVVVLTVRKGRKTMQAVYEKGADGYLTKPFMVDDLLEVLEEKILRCHIP